MNELISAYFILWLLMIPLADPGVGDLFSSLAINDITGGFGVGDLPPSPWFFLAPSFPVFFLFYSFI
jgi:hypothetical protein